MQLSKLHLILGYSLSMDNQFSMGLHILGNLAARSGQLLTSVELARTYGTSPVVLRRVLAKLQSAGLVETRRGTGGGCILARDSAKINLRQVYEAVTENTQVLQRYPQGCAGEVSRYLSEYLNEAFGEAEKALLQKLQQVTLAEMDREVRSRRKSDRS